MRKKRNFFVWTVLLVVILSGINLFFPFFPAVRKTTLSVTAPLQQFLLGKNIEFQQKVDIFQNAKDVQEEIDKLRSENRELQILYTQIKEVKKENEALRSVLDVDFDTERDYVFARVTGRELSSDNLILQHDKEIKQGSAVITPEGVLVGTVQESRDHFSTVRLITSEESSFEVKTQGEEEAIGVLRGTGERKLFLDLLPKDKEVVYGDRVVSLAGEKMQIQGLYIGRVVELMENDVEAFNTATVWQGVDYRYLDHLFIVEK